MLVALLQDVDDLRIERLSRFARELLHHVFQRQGAAVLPIGGQRVEIVDGGEDACADGDFRSLEAERISGAVPLLMVSAHDRHDWIREAYALQNFGANQSVNLHLLELFRSEASGF